VNRRKEEEEKKSERERYLLSKSLIVRDTAGGVGVLQ
jgi:hypothetical protein